jgi:epoxide hydrolase
VHLLSLRRGVSVAAVNAGSGAESGLAVRAELLQCRESGVVPPARVQGRQPLPRQPLRVAGRQVEHFRAEIPQADLDDLHDRLDRVRWPDELPGVGWDLGIPLDRMRELATYRRGKIDWRAQEAALNRYPQYTTEVDGQNVHFLHVRPVNPDALPLVLTHGWPGSVLEFLDVIEPLSADFHQVIPSIPGFGFSGPTHSKGWDIHRIARAWAVLMERLGYQRYGAHGGDRGSGISRALGAVAPAHVVGVHLTYLVTPLPPGAGEPSLSPGDQACLAKITQLQARQPAYQALHATRPQTISYALTDSPAGLLAWIAEKFTEWADPRSAITLDQILADVSTTSSTGPSSTAADTSPDWKSPACWAPTSATSSVSSRRLSADFHAGGSAQRQVIS